MKTRFFLAILLIAYNWTQAQASQQYVFEKADVLTRPLTWEFLQPILRLDVEHAGLYLNSNSVYRFTKEQALANALPETNPSDGSHSVIHAPGYGEFYDDVTGQTNTGVQIVSFQGFLSSKASEYRGARESSLLNATKRHSAILAAGRQLGTEFTFFSKWKGPDYLRCDGLVRYVYSQPDVNAPFAEEPGGWRKNYPRDLRAQLTLANARAPVCASAQTIVNGSSFTIETGSVKDDANGSGVDRVEFYYGYPNTSNMIGSDDHDSNPDAGLAGSTAYSVSSSFDPGSYLHTKIYDQAGNWAICNASGQSVGTSDLTQTQPTFAEDVAAPSLTNLAVQVYSVGTSATVSWSSSDNQTASSDMQFAYAIDVPFDQWDDPVVTVLGKVPVSGTHETTADLSGLNDGTHTFYLIGIDEEGNIGSQQATFQLDTTPPAAPNLTQRDVRGGDGCAMVTWTPPTKNADGSTPLSDLAGYRLYYAVGADPRAGWMVDLAASIQSQELTELVNGMPHTVCVTAVDTVGNQSACSDNVSVTPMGGDVHGQPGEIRWVHKEGGPSGSYTKISEALSGAPNGTTIMVGPDVYSETAPLLVGAAGDDTANSGWYPRNIWLMSERGPAETKILATQINVGDLCRVVGFTMRHPDGDALRISFDQGVLVANNIFLGSQTAIFSGGPYGAGLDDPDDEDLTRNRIYNNVFAGNVIGVNLWWSYAVTDIQNNIFEKAGGGKAIDYDLVCGNAFVQHNVMHGYGGNPNEKNRCAVVAFNTSCDPGFVRLNGGDLLDSDFHIQGTSSCTIDKGAPGLTYQDIDRDIEWTDCVAAAGNSRRADYGAYGGRSRTPTRMRTVSPTAARLQAIPSRSR